MESKFQEEPKLHSPLHYFICSDCEALLSLEESLFMNDGYSLSCQNCNRPISIRPISSEDGIEVLEIFGCQYHGKNPPKNQVKAHYSITHQEGDLHKEVVTWISDQLPANELPTIQSTASDLDKNSFVDALVKKWEVQRTDGQVLQFEFFSLLREWIQEGKISAGDFILPEGGEKCKIEDYPGTADLFGNTANRTQAKFLIGERPQNKIKEMSPLLRGILFFGTTFLIAGLIVFGPYAYKKWKIQQGHRLIQQFHSLSNKSQLKTKEELLQTAQKLLLTNSLNTLPQLLLDLEKAVVTQPRDPELVGYTIEVLLEMGSLTGEKSEMERAKVLFQYLDALFPKHFSTQKAKSHWLWRTGKLEEALQQLEEISSPNIEVSALSARVALDKGDQNKAVIHFSKALQEDPKNIGFLVALAEIMEEQSKFSEAASYWEKVLEISPNHSQAQKQLKQMYLQSQDFFSLEKIYRKSMTQGFEKQKNWFELIQLLKKQNREDELIQEALKYIRYYPEGVDTQKVRALYEEALKKKAPSPVKKAKPSSSSRRRRR